MFLKMGDAQVETKLCNNCKKQISASNFVMHEMHCKRHISLCKHCNEPIPSNEMSVHFEENHAKIKCPKCDTEVEKMHLEDHEENACPKKPMHCVYCELEVPKDKLESHLDYCGSRTEQCPKCGQFIMLKDQTKHDDSNCNFPEAQIKPKSNHDQYSNLVNEMFGKSGVHVGSRAYELDDDNVFDGDVGFRRQANVRHVSKVGSKKTDVNRQNGERETEYDKLLAMHLAQDLHQDDSLEDIVRAFDKQQSPVYPSAQNRYGQNSLSEDFVMIPCEFCGEPFDSEELVQHQSGCSLERISAMLPQMGTANNTRDLPNSQSNAVELPSIINNLQAYSADDWLDDTADVAGYDIPPQTIDVGGEDLFLPCEFCNDLFPMDSLVQHQAMCDRMTMTPRPDTPPDEQRPKPKKKNSFTNAQRLAADFPNLNSKRHQPPPTLFNSHLDSDDDNIPDQNRNSHQVQKPKPATNGSYKTNVTSPAREIRTTLKKYGVETPDRGDYYTRQGNSSRQSNDSTSDSWLEPCSRVQKKYSGSSVRTRSTLHNLLNDDETSHNVLGHIGSAQTRKRETNPLTRQKVSVNPSNTRGVAKVKTTTSAKDVQKEISRQTAGASGSSPSGNVLQPKNISGKPGFDVRVRPSEADEPSDLVSGQRLRTRANNVFGASSYKPRTTRRSDN